MYAFMLIPTTNKKMNDYGSMTLTMYQNYKKQKKRKKKEKLGGMDKKLQYYFLTKRLARFNSQLKQHVWYQLSWMQLTSNEKENPLP